MRKSLGSPSPNSAGRMTVGRQMPKHAGLLVFARPQATAAWLGLAEFPWANRLFYAGLVMAMIALGCLAIRLWARLLAGGRRRPEPGECRAVAGTVMVEFALVFPLVLLVM